MTLSSAPWWWAPVLAPAWMTTVPAHSFSAPTRAKLIAAARLMPGVWAVFGSSSPAGWTGTPRRFQVSPDVMGVSLAPPARRAQFRRTRELDGRQSFPLFDGHSGEVVLGPELHPKLRRGVV